MQRAWVQFPASSWRLITLYIWFQRIWHPLLAFWSTRHAHSMQSTYAHKINVFIFIVGPGGHKGQEAQGRDLVFWIARS